MDDTATRTLLSRMHQGDEAALGRIVARDLDWVRARVEARMGPALRERAEPQDVVQEAMIQVLKDGPRFLVSTKEQCRALVARIVENVLRNRARDSRRKRRDVDRERAFTPSQVLELDASMTSPSSAAVRSEELSWIRLGLEFLEDGHRRVIELRDFQGLAFAEIAAELDTTEDAARARYHRALKRLETKLEGLRAGRLGSLLDGDRE